MPDTAPTATGALRELVADELSAPAPAAALALAEAIRERHGAALSAVIFYGSCLRKRTHEGVLDFYVLVDSYRDTYAPGWLRISNTVLPPNVFYLETQAVLEAGGAPTELRCKYAVVSSSDFEALVSPSCMHPYIWARFAQPAMTVWARDDEARTHVERCAATAICTLVERLTPFLPARGRVQRFRFSALWQEAFRRTYRTEFRGESSETIRAHYEADPERYERAARCALGVLKDAGRIEDFASFSGAAEVYLSPFRRTLLRLRWQLAWPFSKSLSLVRLFKTATTFGDWLPYALWKLERHSGSHLELTKRQREHPLIFGWPVILRILSQRSLR